MSTDDVSFLSRLRAERSRLELSQQEVATACGISREAWGRYEAGKNVPGGEILYKFWVAGADINYIFSGTLATGALRQEVAGYNRGDIDLIVDAYAHTDDDGRAALLAVAKVIKKT